MTQRTLEERVSTLEATVARLVAGVGADKLRRDWQGTVGMFEGDPVIQEIQEEGRKIREAERHAAREDAKR